MGEISAASNEQSLGVSQVGEAVTQMDQVTQQNAALVEEMAAAASSLKSQAQDLVQVVAVFKLANSAQGSMLEFEQQKTRSQVKFRSGNVPVAKRPTLPKPVKALFASAAAPTVAKQGSDEDWESF
jgi:hypothetical protein